MEPRNRFQFMNSASLCSLAGRYVNPIPTRCLAPIDFLKIPALNVQNMSASGFDLKGLCQALKKLVFVLFEQQVQICILTRSRAKNWYFSCKNIVDFLTYFDYSLKKQINRISRLQCEILLKFIHQLDGHKITLIKKRGKFASYTQTLGHLSGQNSYMRGKVLLTERKMCEFFSII